MCCSRTGRCWRACSHSLSLAAVAAVIGLILGFAVAYILTYSQFKLKRLIDMLTLVAMAVPGVVLGIGYIFVWNQKWLQPLGLNLYGKPSILVLASVASAVPLINRVLVGGMSKVPMELLTASQVQGARLGRRLKTVLLAAAALQHGIRGAGGLRRKRVQPGHHHHFVSAEFQHAAGVHQRLLQRFKLRLCGRGHHRGRNLYRGDHASAGSDFKYWKEEPECRPYLRLRM